MTNWRSKIPTKTGIFSLFWMAGAQRRGSGEEGAREGGSEGGRETLFGGLLQQQCRCSFQNTTSPSSRDTRRAAGCLLSAPPLCALDTSPPFHALLQKNTIGPHTPRFQVAKEHERKTKRSSQVEPLCLVKSLLFCDYFLFSRNQNESFRNNTSVLFLGFFFTQHLGRGGFWPTPSHVM